MTGGRTDEHLADAEVQKALARTGADRGCRQVSNVEAELALTESPPALWSTPLLRERDRGEKAFTADA